MKTLLLLVLALLPLISGCGKSGGGKVADTTPAAVFPWPEGELARIDAQFGRLVETSTGLRYQPMAPGFGDATPQSGNLVSAHYRGTLLDGTVFDDSYKRGQPIRFPVGVGRVIKGWDEGLLDMRRGEKRRLVIPYWLAYGEAGRPGSIPRKATLVFEVELIDWETAVTQ